MNDTELKNDVRRMMLHFDLGVLASYRQEAHRYEVTTDNFEGRVTLRSDFYETLSDDERQSQNLNIQFGFRAKRDGSLAVAAWGPDFENAGTDQKRKWTAFHVAVDGFPEEFDARFNLWVQRYLSGNWDIDNGPLSRLTAVLEEIDSLTLEAVERRLFKAGASHRLIFPSAENDEAYADAHSAIYGLVIDGLDKDTMAALAHRLGRTGKFDSDTTLKSLRKIVSDTTLHPGIFDPFDVVSRCRHASDHGVRSPPSAFAAFDHFVTDAEAVVSGLVMLRGYLSEQLNLDVNNCMDRRMKKSMVPQIDITRPPQPNYSIMQVDKITGKTIEKVEFGFRRPIGGVHDSELIILYFTDGSTMSIDTGSNAGNLSDEYEGLKPEDFHSSFSLNFVPPPSTPNTDRD